MHAYQDMVFSTAARLTGNDAQAEDIAQEVFLKAYENFDQLHSSPAAGRFFSELRRDDSDDEPELEFATPDLTPDSIIADIDTEQRHALIEQALRELPEHHRVPLVLYHFEEMPYLDIAKQLRVSLPKVKTDIQRARAALAKILTRRGLVRASVAST